MKCKVDGCEKDATYKSESLCQKHYFRKWRYGTTELTRDKKLREIGYTRVYRITMPGKGYQRVYEPLHPLADGQGYVAEHRMVLWDRYGNNLPPCELCGAESSWATSHIDHRDNDVKNNAADNLRPLCRPCNTFRDMRPAHTFDRCMSLTYEGKTDTPHGWSRDPRVSVSSSTIRKRKLKGMSDFDALFSKKITHQSKDAQKPSPTKYLKINHED